MKKIVYNKIILTTLCLIMSATFFTSCEKDDVGGPVELQAFGPNPVLRGNKIAIIGNNLDKVTAVIIPGCSDITEIEKVSPSEIKVTVPQEAKEGQIRIKFQGGEITSKSSISFTEPYVIESISPIEEAIREGDEVTIMGDYLWNIVRVVFSGNEPEALADSAVFVSQERKSIVVKVPRGAASGKLKIVDEPGNELYSNQELTIKQPKITKISPLHIKAGADLTIEGTELDLVLSIRFEGNTLTDTTAFKSQNSTKLVVTVPDDAHDGKIISIAYSNEEFESKEALDMIIPTNLKVTAPDGFKAGKAVEITGNDLDLITKVVFEKDLEVETFIKTSDKITVSIPVTAVDGSISLSTAAEKWAKTNEFTLVKPVITSLTPTTITAGEEFKITGTDLDLVTSIKVGSIVCTIKNSSATELTVSTPLNCTSGTVEVVAANGDKTTSNSDLIVNPSTKPTVTSMPSSAKPGDEITLLGANLNNVKTILFGTVAVSRYSVRTATELVFTIPQNAPKGKQKIKFELYEGDDAETDQEITIGGKDPVTDWDLVIFDFEDHGGNFVADNAASWGGIGDVLGREDGNYFFEVKPTSTNIEAYWYVADNWIEAPYPSVSGISDYVLKIDIRLKQDIPVPGDWHVINVRIAGNIEYNILPYIKDGDVYTTSGDWTTIAIPLEDIAGLSDPTATSGDWGVIFNKNDVAFSTIGLCIDNIRYEHK